MITNTFIWTEKMKSDFLKVKSDLAD
jgi:hypothetical protein